MPPAELPITGYLDRFSHRPGERFAAQVSVTGGGQARARLLRVISGDPNPEGPGLRFEDLSHRFDIAFAGRHQPIRAGSCAIVPQPPKRTAGPCTWTALVWLAALPGHDAAVISEEQDGAAVTLSVGPRGAAAEVGGHRLELGAPWPLRRWMRLWVGADPGTGRIALGQQPLGGGAASVATATHPGLALPDGGGTLLIAARGAAAPHAHLTGKIEDPALLAVFLEAWPGPDVPLAADHPGLLAGWDFAQGIPTQAITDIGPQGCHGALANVPTRAVVGARWSGAEMCWRHAPADYAAIHFHADDLGDCRWETDFTFDVPDDLPSGAYAFHLTCAGGEDFLPFYVLPPRGVARAPVAFLASTFTYQAYANHARGKGMSRPMLRRGKRRCPP